MNNSLIHFALKLWKEKQPAQADLSFWQEILPNYPDTDPAQIVFLRNLFPTSAEAELWLKERFSLDPSMFLTRNSDGKIGIRNKQLSGRLLDEWNSQLIDSEDAKIHRRFLRKSYQERLEANTSLILATLVFLEDTYPLTKKAARFLSKWKKELDRSDSPKAHEFRFPWRPLVLGFALATLAIFFIYLIASRPEGESMIQQETTPAPIPAIVVEPPQPQPSAISPPKRSYEVKTGDMLWKIAQDQLGAAARWEDIYRLNQSLLPNPDYLLPGWKLDLPDIQGTSQ